MTDIIKNSGDCYWKVRFDDEDRVRKRKERIDLVRKNYNWINIANKFIY